MQELFDRLDGVSHRISNIWTQCNFAIGQSETKIVYIKNQAFSRREKSKILKILVNLLKTTSHYKTKIDTNRRLVDGIHISRMKTVSFKTEMC